MSLKECYDKMGADYEDVLSRLRSEVLVRKFALKFLDDDSYANLKRWKAETPRKHFAALIP